jgi:hypothetical protein
VGGRSSNSKNQIQKQFKKPDLYEEEKIERKIETKKRRPYGGWVVGVLFNGGDSAWLGWARRGGTVDGLLELYSGWVFGA